MRFVLAVLVTWRITHLLAHEDGPANIIARIRSRLGDGLLGSLMDCFNCLSLWIAALTALSISHQGMTWVISWLAISGAACLLERMGAKPVLIEATQQSPEGDHHVLR
ncbi:MAG TPA: DUF1360 domain-containing protein [Candidatus Sulfotelmatobacter sp.]